MGAMVGRQARRKAEKLTSPLTTLSFWGQTLAVAAFVAGLVFVVLMALYATRVDVSQGREAIIARNTVNIRQAPTTGSAVVTQANAGDRFTITGTEGRWTKIHLAGGMGAGWIASSLVDTKTAKTLVVSYDMKGYFTALLISLVVLFFALRMKRVGAPSGQAAPGANPNETLLVDRNGKS
jgi:hypothetical protein